MKKTRGRPFKSGNEFGRGRPKGSRNKTAAEAQELLSQHALTITKRCIVGAIRGESQCLKICMERILPAPRDPFVDAALPRVRSREDLPRMWHALVRAIEKNELTPAQAEMIANTFGILLQFLPEKQDQLAPKAVLPEFLTQALLAAQKGEPDNRSPNDGEPKGAGINPSPPASGQQP